MRTTLIAITFLALGLAACAAPDLKPIGLHPLRNAEGHVIGHKETLRDSRGSEVEHITLYTPRYGDKGEIVGYDEPVGSGAILRNLDGKRIGARHVDLRSRGTNERNPGITTIYGGQ